MKICIDACMRMSCGAASQGGDTKITNVVLQDASFPLSIGRTEHSFLLGTLNCGETDQWLKYALFLWAQEAWFLEKNLKLTPHSTGDKESLMRESEPIESRQLQQNQQSARIPNLMKGRQGELTRFWLVGDLKLLDWLHCGGGLSCSMALNRFRMFLIAANLTWFIKFEFSDSEAVETQRKVGEPTFVISRFMSHRVNCLFLKKIITHSKSFMQQISLTTKRLQARWMSSSKPFPQFGKLLTKK